MTDKPFDIIDFFKSGQPMPHQAWSGITGLANRYNVPGILRQQGEYASRAGGYVGLGGTGLAALGAATAQPELFVPGLAGMAVGGAFNELGDGATYLADILSGDTRQLLRDGTAGYVNRHLPPTINSQPVIDRTANYFGF